MIGPYLDFFFVLIVNDNPVIDADMNILQMSVLSCYLKYGMLLKGIVRSYEILYSFPLFLYFFVHKPAIDANMNILQCLCSFLLEKVWHAF